MATAKLWWDGSAWSTSETWWADNTSGGNTSWARVQYKNKIVAYDDGTIKMSTVLKPLSSYGTPYLNGGTKTVKSGDTTIGSGEFSDKDVTSYTTFKYSGSVAVAMNEYGGTTWHAGVPNDSSGSTTITSPFRTISFNANGGSDAPSSQKVCVGVSSNLTASTPNRPNHEFLGWSESASAHTPSYVAGGSITVNDNTTLYAVWQPCVFISADEGVTITFDGVSYSDTTATVGKTWGNEYALLVTPNTGFIVKTQSHPNGNVEINADEITISATGQRVGCHIDDGESWIQAVIYFDDGDGWVMIQAYIDDGNSWNLVY